ncbi:hypothetical protein M0R45_029871 [Rubus argutus]|uniref:Mitochondrial fission protein ELM1 n=1 Tax=Rubus argutus TaxID=59490 RepID=A0AAW1WD87_RUBAR
MVQGGTQRAIRRAIVIGNGFAGAENQSIGLVRALGLSDRQSLYRVTRPRGGINKWLPWLPLSLHKKVDYVISGIKGNRKVMPFSAENNIGLSSGIVEADAKQIAKMARQTFDKDGPLLVVASGRDTIPVASAIKRLAPENVFLVQIQHPRSHLNRWITPREPPGRNVVLTIGALHQADSAALRSAASAWHTELAPLPKPLLVVNIGNCSYGVDLGKQLVAMLRNVLWSCGSVRISFSRRTPEKVSKLLIKEFRNNPKVYIWDGEGRNPHMGHLALADDFIITADSVSMLSEACSTGNLFM